jgi:hypothetical protein
VKYYHNPSIQSHTAYVDASFTARMVSREKRIQQGYRPVIGAHAWFAPRPGASLRNLLLCALDSDEPMASACFRWHRFGEP